MKQSSTIPLSLSLFFQRFSSWYNQIFLAHFFPKKLFSFWPSILIQNSFLASSHPLGGLPTAHCSSKWRWRPAAAKYWAECRASSMQINYHSVTTPCISMYWMTNWCAYLFLAVLNNSSSRRCAVHQDDSHDSVRVSHLKKVCSKFSDEVFKKNIIVCHWPVVRLFFLSKTREKVSKSKANSDSSFSKLTQLQTNVLKDQILWTHCKSADDIGSDSFSKSDCWLDFEFVEHCTQIISDSVKSWEVAEKVGRIVLLSRNADVEKDGLLLDGSHAWVVDETHKTLVWKFGILIYFLNLILMIKELHIYWKVHLIEKSLKYVLK